MRYRFSLGPFHPGWPGPLRFDLEVEDGIVRTAEAVMIGLEKIRAEEWAGLSVEEGLSRVEKLCAPSSWAYTTAYCQALETLAGREVPPRGRYLRVLLAELERATSHLLAAAQILELAGLPAVAASLMDLREEVVRSQQQLTGRRFFSGLNVPGGLRQDLDNLDTLPGLVRWIKGPLYRLSHRVVSNRPVVSLLVGSGLLTKEKAEEEGIGGPAARASESARDLRPDQPYAAYAELDPQVVTQGGGDAFARWMVLILETFESLRLVEAVAQQLPGGPVCSDGGIEVPPGEALARLESPAGPLQVRVQIEESGRLAGLWRTAPSQVHLAMLPQVLPGQQLDLVGVIVASWGLCSPCLTR